ncbi:MAG: hypothetical protein ABR499_22190 [Gemmatimonadaceae bacterium]
MTTTSSVAVRAETRTRGASAADLAVIVAVIVAGAAAAHLAMPALWAVTPIAAGTLFVAALRAVRLRDVAFAAGSPGAPLPPRLERSSAEAFAALPAGDARELLGDVVRRARALLETFAGQADERRLTRDVSDLVEACCEIAREHARLDAVLPALWEPALASAGARRAADGASGDELRRRGDAARELLTRRLRDAAAVLEEMLVQRGVERGGSAAERVAELTSELAAEAAARRHAAQEIQRFLSR